MKDEEKPSESEHSMSSLWICMKIELSAFGHVPNTLQEWQISKNYKCEIHNVTFEYEAPLEILIRYTDIFPISLNCGKSAQNPSTLGEIIKKLIPSTYVLHILCFYKIN